MVFCGILWWYDTCLIYHIYNISWEIQLWSSIPIEWLVSGCRAGKPSMGSLIFPANETSMTTSRISHGWRLRRLCHVHFFLNILEHSWNPTEPQSSQSSQSPTWNHPPPGFGFPCPIIQLGRHGVTTTILPSQGDFERLIQAGRVDIQNETPCLPTLNCERNLVMILFWWFNFDSGYTKIYFCCPFHHDTSPIVHMKSPLCSNPHVCWWNPSSFILNLSNPNVFSLVKSHNLTHIFSMAFHGRNHRFRPVTVTATDPSGTSFVSSGANHRLGSGCAFNGQLDQLDILSRCVFLSWRTSWVTLWKIWVSLMV